ncbi:MAG: WD40 repeat domain-containing protein [Verrucomicrobiales bacterium]|nr:WD40 repeat domain-containing protein [Verrucomicrobiales bacterium]
MIFLPRVEALLSALTFMTMAISVVSADLFGISTQSSFIDSATGKGTPIEGVTWDHQNALAQDGQGRILAISEGQLVQVDPYHLTLTPLVGLTRPVGATGLAVSPSGELFAVARDELQPTGTDPLYHINLATGQNTRIGDTGLHGVQDLAFSPGGVLYGWSVSAGLVRIDPSTGQGVDVNPALGRTAEIQALVFTPDGTLYGARDALFKVDTTTGATTEIGSGGFADIRGLAFIPEPSVLAVFVMGGMALALGGRRQVVGSSASRSFTQA